MAQVPLRQSFVMTEEIALLFVAFWGKISSKSESSQTTIILVVNFHVLIDLAAVTSATSLPKYFVLISFGHLMHCFM